MCAGRDDDRLADLNDAFLDREVRAIVTTRGGAGAYRIADLLDFGAAAADPKLLVGFSDITHLTSPCGGTRCCRRSTEHSQERPPRRPRGNSS
ncbi:MAG: LD-carboxypeptidase [Acidimicrobiia bacterium]|nr:LD-carboxypeptidase [Acidimicrobiia bacterium]